MEAVLSRKEEDKSHSRDGNTGHIIQSKSSKRPEQHEFIMAAQVRYV
jgi:hypothetical protein